MSGAIEVTITGLEDAFALLTRLKKPSQATPILRQALRYGTTPILQAARAAAPVETSLLKKSLGIKIKSYDSGSVVAIIGPRKGFKRPVFIGRMGGFLGKRAAKQHLKAKGAGRVLIRDPAKYAHLVERGTKRSKAKAFLGPAWVGARAAAKKRIADKIKELVLKRLAK